MLSRFKPDVPGILAYCIDGSEKYYFWNLNVLNVAILSKKEEIKITIISL